MPTDPARAPVSVDARGQKCPLPVLRAEKALAGLSQGDVLIVLVTDPMARIDIPLYCRQHGHACNVEETDGALRFTVTAYATAQ